MNSHKQEENAEFCTIYSNNVCDVNTWVRFSGKIKSMDLLFRPFCNLRPILTDGLYLKLRWVGVCDRVLAFCDSRVSTNLFKAREALTLLLSNKIGLSIEAALKRTPRPSFATNRSC